MTSNVLPAFLLAAFAVLSSSAQDSSSGHEVYTASCVGCHGAQGEGVAGKHDEALYGQRSVESLAELIQRTMPEDKPGTLSRQAATNVAAYIHKEFYSPEARARLNPSRIELAHLTNRQFRESVADLLGSFKHPPGKLTPGGLAADYFQSDGMNKKAKKAFTRTDRAIDFDFGTNSPGESITDDQFSIAWQGSLLAPDTGLYEFRVRTPNGARLYLNKDLRAGDANTRDDSDERRHSALIDLWVSSGQVREATTRLFLLGGRSYPLRLDFFKFKDPQASLRLEWKPPHGEWSVLEGDFLSPQTSPTVFVVTTSFPPDDGSLGYERGTAMSLAWQQKVFEAALETANEMVAKLPTLSGVSDKTTDRERKLRQFAKTFADRAFRRPLSPELTRTYIDRHFENAPTPEIALKRSVTLVISSPRFLYPALNQETDSYTVGTRLALNLWDSIPDQSLYDAAKRGDLLRDEVVRTHAKRMLTDPRAHTKLREFFHHWLVMTEDGEILAKDTAAFPGFDAALVSDLRRSLDTFVDHVVWGEKSDYRELLQADYMFVNSRLADYYRTAQPTNGGFQPVVLDDGKRAGIFTHPYVLATLSYHRSTSPIHRGVFLTRNVLGRFLKPPPMAISFMDDRFDPSLTMREKVTELTRSDTCMGCHITINPLGFSLENFDATGRWRTEDNRKPVNAESDYVAPDGRIIRLTGARDLAQHTAANREARTGFIRQLYHHTAKQAAAAYHPQTLNDFEAIFADSEFNIRNLFMEIALFTATFDLDQAIQ